MYACSFDAQTGQTAVGGMQANSPIMTLWQWVLVHGVKVTKSLAMFPLCCSCSHQLRSRCSCNGEQFIAKVTDCQTSCRTTSTKRMMRTPGGSPPAPPPQSSTQRGSVDPLSRCALGRRPHSDPPTKYACVLPFCTHNRKQCCCHSL